MLYIVTLYDMSDYDENVVYAPDAPIEVQITTTDQLEAWDWLLEFGAEFAGKIETINGEANATTPISRQIDCNCDAPFEHAAPKAAARPKLSKEEAIARRVEGKREKAAARKQEDAQRAQQAAQEAVKGIPAAQAKYDEALEATAKAKDIDDVKAAFDKADRAQNTLMSLIASAKRAQVTA
jgi:hypothetical protein